MKFTLSVIALFAATSLATPMTNLDKRASATIHYYESSSCGGGAVSTVSLTSGKCYNVSPSGNGPFFTLTTTGGSVEGYGVNGCSGSGTAVPVNECLYAGAGGPPSGFDSVKFTA